MEGFVNLAWLVPVPPFLAFLAIILFTNHNKTVSAILAIFGAVVTWLLSWPIAYYAFTTDHFSEHPVEISLYTIPTGYTSIGIGSIVDAPNALMLFMVSFLLVMIFVYASGYMSFPAHLRREDYPEAAAQNKDPRYSRFMAYISLFATGMTGLVVANSLITFFIFWEVMGLCSYLLIGFWYEKASARAACVKAFMTTRVGDAFMFIGMMLLYVYTTPTPSLMFSEFLDIHNLKHLDEQMVDVPLFGLVSILGLVSMLIFMGTVGKSAQFPLHVWLPDAMEGPTPVSAMIHAATMVSAGVFLLVRLYPVYAVALEFSPDTMQFVALIGGFTALFAATIAVAQWDIKRVLAYSTISQLGYMVAAIGIGAFPAAIFHLITHAFFKALLFLGSGSVIHGVEHGLHHVHEHGHDSHRHGEHHHAPTLIERKDGLLDPEDPQDMRNMGGLLRRMPLTGFTFIIGGLALSGFPLITAGFWSKDEILAFSWANGNTTVFWTLALAAFLTAFYTMRQIGMTFWGKPRTEMAEHAPESVASMTIPLVLIAPFAIFLGWFGIPENFAIIGGIVPNWLEHFLDPHIEYLHIHVVHPHFNWIPLIVSLAVALGGLALGYTIYGNGLGEGEVDPMRRAFGSLWMVLHHKYRIDEIYGATIVALTRWLCDFLYKIDAKWIIDPVVNAVASLGVWFSVVSAEFDRYVIDGVVNGVASVMSFFGGLFRNTQNGLVQVYLLALAVSVVVWLLLKAMPVILTLV